MVVLKNNKKITVTFEGMKIDPFGSVRLSEERWAELYKKKEIRQSVAIGYMTATKEANPEPAKNEAPVPEANKSKKGK